MKQTASKKTTIHRADLVGSGSGSVKIPVTLILHLRVTPITLLHEGVFYIQSILQAHCFHAKQLSWKPELYRELQMQKSKIRIN